jgi:hypothetical protein
VFTTPNGETKEPMISSGSLDDMMSVQTSLPADLPFYLGAVRSLAAQAEACKAQPLGSRHSRMYDIMKLTFTKPE